MTDTSPRPDLIERLDAAYTRMVAEARYRPGAPSDGFGSLLDPRSRVSKAEREAWIRSWLVDEETGAPNIGYASFSDRPALALAVEGNRALCGGDRRLAAKLLRMAADDLDSRA